MIATWHYLKKQSFELDHPPQNCALLKKYKAVLRLAHIVGWIIGLITKVTIRCNFFLKVPKLDQLKPMMNLKPCCNRKMCGETRDLVPKKPPTLPRAFRSYRLFGPSNACCCLKADCYSSAFSRSLSTWRSCFQGNNFCSQLCVFGKCDWSCWKLGLWILDQKRHPPNAWSYYHAKLFGFGVGSYEPVYGKPHVFMALVDLAHIYLPVENGNTSFLWTPRIHEKMKILSPKDMGYKGTVSSHG